MAVAGSLGGGGSGAGAGAGAGGAAGPAGPDAPVVAGASDLEMMPVWLATVVVVVGPVVEVVVGDATDCGRVTGGAMASAWAGMGTVSNPAKVKSDTTPAAAIRPWRAVRDGCVTSP